MHTYTTACAHYTILRHDYKITLWKMAPLPRTVANSLSVYVMMKLIKRRKKRRRACWVRPWIRMHRQHGYYENLVTELATKDVGSFRNFSRMYPHLFSYLEYLVTPLISKQNTKFRPSISPGERLAVTLRFLATGETFRSLAFQFRLGETTIGKIVPETCDALYEVLKEKYFKCPNTPEEWKKVAAGFLETWNLPNCIGTLDGKHVNIKPPKNSGSTYFNYKHTFSVVLMALVDSEYKFLYVDVGANGRISDAGVFKGCSLEQALERRSANIPPPAPFPGDERPVNHFIVGDEAFPLKDYLIKPYAYRNLDLAHRVFNYRLSRARRVVENAFGILANRFRVFQTNIALEPTKVEKLVLASCALHNFLRVEAGTSYLNTVIDKEDFQTHDVIPGSWRNDPQLLNAALFTNHNYSNTAKQLRDYVCAYVNSETGSVPWQWDKI